MIIKRSHKLHFFCFALFVVTLFGACTKKELETNSVNNKQQSEKKETIELKFLGEWEGQGDRETFITNFVRDYNFENQHLRIVMKFPSEVLQKYGENGNVEWIKDQIHAEQSDFDIIKIDNQVNLLPDEPNWAAKYLVDFNQIEEYKNNTNPELLNDSIIKYWGGIIPGPFLEGFYFALWCNLDVAEKVGIEVKQFGMTFDDFVGYIKAVHKYNDQYKDEYIYPILDAGADWKTLIYLFNQLYMSHLNNDELFFKNQLSEEKLDAWHKTLKDLERLQPYQPLGADWDSIAWSKSSDKPIEGKCLFFSNGSWMYSQWNKTDKNKLGKMMPVEYPVANPVNYSVGGYAIQWAVPKNAPNKDEAIKFLLALNSSKYAEKWIRYTKCPTGIKGKLASVSFGVDKFEDFTYNIINKYNDKLYSSYDSRHVFDSVHASLNNYAHEVLLGRISADEAMEKIREGLQ